MLMSGLFGEDLFDEFWGFPTQRELANIDKHLYGKNARNLMKTDVHENETDYEMEMDLPGFKKDQINVKLDTCSANASSLCVPGQVTELL